MKKLIFNWNNEEMAVTKSELKRIEAHQNNHLHKIVDVCRSNGNLLLITIERTNVRSTTEHIPPFKYRRICYGRNGGKLYSWSGNVWDGEDIIDDFYEDRSSHLNGYRA